MRSLIRVLASFGGLQLFVLLSPFLLLPIVARVAGEAGWASIAVGQAIGGVGAIAVTFGWSLLGPSRVAAAEASDVRLIYAESLVARSAVLAVVCPVVLLTTALLSTEEFRLVSIGMALAMVLTGLSPHWLYVGLGKVKPLVLLEALPKLLSNVLAALLILLTGQLAFYPVMLLAASAFTLLMISARETNRRSILAELSWGKLRISLRHHASAAGTDILGSSYSSSPLIVAGAFVPTSGVAQLASADKLYKLGLYAIAAAGSAMQSWIYGEYKVPTRRRSLAALWTHLLLGAIGALILTLIGPFATSILFGEPLRAEFAVMAWYGATYFALSVATSLMRHVLVPAGRGRIVFLGNAAAACIGLPTMIALATHYGASGVVAGLALSEFIVAIVLVFPAVGRLRNLR